MASPGACCSAMNCRNRQSKCPELSFFRFPKDTERCQKWVQNTRRVDILNKSTQYLSKNCRLCSAHFTTNQFSNKAIRNRLNWNAVPTIFSAVNLQKGKALTTRRFRRKKRVEEDLTAKVSHLETKERDNGLLAPGGPIESHLGGSSLENTAPTILDFPDNLNKVSPKPTAEEGEEEAAETPNTQTTGEPTALPESHDHCYFIRDTPVALKRKLDFICAKLGSTKKCLKGTQQKCRRLQRKVCSLEETVRALKAKLKIPSTQTSLDSLSETFPGIAVELLKRMFRKEKIGRASHGEHSAVVADFASKLMSISTKAYIHTHKSFDCALPHPSMVRKWCRGKKEAKKQDLDSVLTLPLESLMSNEELSELLLIHTD